MRKIKNEDILDSLCNIFMDGEELTRTSYSKEELSSIIKDDLHSKFPENTLEEITWKRIYALLLKKLKEVENLLVDGIFEKLADSLDHESDEAYFREVIIPFLNWNKIPWVRYNRDIKTYQAVANLKLYESFYNIDILQFYRKLNKKTSISYKLNAKLPNEQPAKELQEEFRALRKLEYKYRKL